ncbi:M3 family oligoendopeptidase [Bavariicoccus seileri]|uniref:M3 family oligoendopeptidase n=1 Tax=Bavariicoccus seileri TaxID=549685 RepID=UPI0003B6BFA1|nr:M3 family oligoendopeptidase [Bavariicoccus seileri]
MKFPNYPYERPDYEAVKKEATFLVDQITHAEDASEVIAAVKAYEALTSKVDSNSQIAAIRHSIDTRDPFYDAENSYWDEHGPLYTELNTAYYKAILETRFEEELSDVIPETFFKMAEYQLKTLSPEVIPLLQKENEVSSSYNKLIASAQIDYDGKKLNLSQFGPYLQSTDREVRHSASTAQWQFFADHEKDFDDIYDQLVKIRHEIAQKLGFKDYVEYSYYNMMRFDYNREMVSTYREQILKDVVPVANRLYERQAERIGVKDMKYYDLPLNFLDGNATPKGTPEEIIKSGQKMYHELSPETGEFIDFMYDHDLLDLLAKEGKDSGGYCTYIPEFKSPFIFANFNGTSGDVDVLTHEAGHAFQIFNSRWITQPEIVFPTYESCEIHSMSMEFFTYPWMNLFFGDQTDKYKFAHLGSAVQFLPYGVLVDHFQHVVYENPELTPDERKAEWRRLEKLYNPHKDYDDNDLLERGGWWFRQGHIFGAPFYYIDYTLAQVCAFQFYKRALVDHDDTAWSDYLEICKVGGTKTFLEIVKLANLVSPFKEGSLTDVIHTIAAELDKVDDKSL